PPERAAERYPDGPPASADEFEPREEIGDLDCRRFRRVGAMDRVLADGEREFLADRARGGVCRVGRAHHLAVLRDRVLALENLHHDRRRGHELAELAVEGALLVDLVELAGLGEAEVDALLRDDPHASLLRSEYRRAGKGDT